MSKKILGLNLGSNSIDWVLMSKENGKVSQIINLDFRIFNIQEFLKFLVNVPVLKISVILIPIIFLYAFASFIDVVRWW